MESKGRHLAIMVVYQKHQNWGQYEVTLSMGGQKLGRYSVATDGDCHGCRHHIGRNRRRVASPICFRGRWRVLHVLWRLEQHLSSHERRRKSVYTGVERKRHAGIIRWAAL